MGFFQKVFGKFTNSNQKTGMKFINDDSNGFFEWDGKLYRSDIIRACIRPKSIAIGKLVPKHIRVNEKEFKVNPVPWIKLLLEDPNPIMSTQVMLEKMIVQLELNNNAFAFIQRNESNIATAIYPLPALSVEVLEGSLGDIFLKFYLNTGKQLVIPYDDIIHLRKDFYNDDFFAETPGEALKNLMEILNTSDQGIIKAIKNSSIIKWILKFTTVLKPTDMKKAVDDFTEDYLKISNNSLGGAAAADGRYDLQQVNNNAYVPDDKQATNTIKRLYSFFNTNEKIVQSNYSEDEWNAYYESQIEPIALQLANEFTRKLFTRNERAHGNKIIFEAASLQYASMSTKMDLVQMVDRGALTPNEWREILSLPPIKGGDKAIRRLDTATVEMAKGGEKNDKGNQKSANADK